MLWILRAANGLAILAGIYAYLVDRNLLFPSLFFVSVVFFISAIRKVFIVGADTLRGRFWAVFSSIGVFMALSVFWEPVSFPNLLMNLLARFTLMISIVMMSVGLAVRGFFIRGVRLLWVLLSFILISLIMLYLAFHSPLGVSWAILFAIADVLVFTFTIYNLLVYLGSELGRRWTEGTLAMLTYIVADMAFIMGNLELSYFLLIIALSLMVLNALIEE